MEHLSLLTAAGGIAVTGTATVGGEDIVVDDDVRLLVTVTPDFSQGGDLLETTGTFKYRNPLGVTLTISKVLASVGTAPTGASILVDVHKNGTTIFTTQGDRPEIAVSTISDTAVPNVTLWGADEYLTVDIDQVGSTLPGTDLTVTVVATG